jgi:ubiquinone/menaquinone biosynthesis C-methylase UbiE
MVMSVRMASVTALMPAALEQALALFEPAARPEPAQLTDGYLDLLGEGDVVLSHVAHRILRSRLMPSLYEHVAHPLAMRMAMGRKAPGRREEQRIALGMVKLSSGERLLDVACGPGNFTRSFAEAASDGLVVGVDASRPMLAAAVRRTDAANTAYILGDACMLPFRASSFDVVSCFGAMHLFEQPLRALEGFVRVLSPGGRIALLTTCDTSRKAGSERAVAHRFGGWQMFKRDELTSALAGHGMVDVEQRVIRVAQFVSARKPAG